MADIVKSRSQSHLRLLPDHLKPGQQDPFAPLMPSAPARPARADAAALDAALNEQGKFRPAPGGEVAARDAMDALTREMQAARSAAQARAGPRAASEVAAKAVVVGERRTHSRDALESAGLSLLRAISAPNLAQQVPEPAKAQEQQRQLEQEEEEDEEAAPAATPAEGVAADTDSEDDAAARRPARSPATQAVPLPRAAPPSAPPPSGRSPAARTTLFLSSSSGLRVVTSDGSFRDGLALPAAVPRQAVVTSLTLLTSPSTAVAALHIPFADGARTVVAAWRLGNTASGEEAPPLTPAWAMQLPPRLGRVHSMCPLSSSRAAAACSSGAVAVWNATQPADAECDIVCGEGEDDASPVYALAPLPGAEVAAGCLDGRIRVFNTWDGGLENMLRGHRLKVTALEALEGGAALVSGDEGGAVRVWDVQAGECVKRFDAHAGPVYSLLRLRWGDCSAAARTAAWRSGTSTRAPRRRRRACPAGQPLACWRWTSAPRAPCVRTARSVACLRTRWSCWDSWGRRTVGLQRVLRGPTLQTQAGRGGTARCPFACGSTCGASRAWAGGAERS